MNGTQLRKIVVLAGSPKGLDSVTVEYVRYLAAQMSDLEFEIIPVASEYRRYERHTEHFDTVMESVSKGDLVLWAFPLYYMLVSSGYKRFIELIFERDKVDVFRDRYAASLSTSIHFYDHTAHNYIQGICDDLGMRYLDSIAMEMHDLFDDNRRLQFAGWFSDIARRIEANEQPQKSYPPIPGPVPTYRLGADDSAKIPGVAGLPTDTGPKTVIVTDGGSKNTTTMVQRYHRTYPNADVVDLSQLRFGHCLGCLKCGFDNVCAYDGTQDEFLGTFQEKIVPAEAIVFALTMKDRYFSSLWQRYLERTFVRTHQPWMEGKQVAYLVSGSLQYNENAREILRSYAEGMGAHLVGIVTDETFDDAIETLAVRVSQAVSADLRPPFTFRGIAGIRLFRDEIFGGLNFVFQQDDKYYRQHGLYDFPHKRYGRRLRSAVMRLLTMIPGMRNEIRDRLASEMLKPYRKLVAATEQQSAGAFSYKD